MYYLKMILVACAILLISTFSSAQASMITQAGYGGSGYDIVRDMVKAADGYYVLFLSDSPGNSGNMSVTKYGNHDYVLVKYDHAMNIQWQKAYGGNQRDIPQGLLLTDNHLYLYGNSESPASGNKTAPSIGDQDIWIVKTDLSGNMVWDKTYGGTLADDVNSMDQIGSEILVGSYSRSADDGNKTTLNIGGADYWMFKIDADGEYTWQRNYGSTGEDYLSSVKIHNSFIYLLGTSYGNQSGDKTENSYGFDDTWIIKTEQNGDIVWDKTIGGSGSDFCTGLSFVNDKTILTMSSLSGISGNRTVPLKGAMDIWSVELSETASIEHQFSFGGDNYDAARVVLEMDDNILAFGTSDSGVSIDKEEASQGQDFWLINFDSEGNLLWQETVVGLDIESGTNMIANNDTIVVGGLSNSPVGGEKTVPNYGDYDGWIIQFEVQSPTKVDEVLHESGVQLYPVPLEEELNIVLSDSKMQIQSIELYDITGKKMLTKHVEGFGPNHQFVLDTSALERGAYLILIAHQDGVVSRTLVK